MNVLKTNLVKEGSKYFVTPCGAKIEVTGEKENLLADKGVESREILLGARPEHIVLADGPAENAIPCKLEVNEMMGSEIHVHASVEGNDNVIIRIPTEN